MIEVKNLTKTYRVSRRDAGFFAAVLFIYFYSFFGNRNPGMAAA